MIPSFETTQHLIRAGRFTTIVEQIGGSNQEIASLTSEHRMAIAHAMFEAGLISRARHLLQTETPAALGPIRCDYELLRAQLYRYDGEVGKSLHHYGIAIQIAREYRDSFRVAWASIQQFRLLAQLGPSDALAPLLREVRRSVAKAGDPHASAYMHDSVALMEASNGRPKEARRHLDVTQSLINAYPNAWLQRVALTSAFFVDFLEGKYDSARANIEAARRLSTLSGERDRWVIGCNHGHVLLALGEFDAALKQFDAVLRGDSALAHVGALDGMARVHLATGNLEACAKALDRHDQIAVRDERLMTAFAGRWTKSTRIKLLLRQERFGMATEAAATFVAETERFNDVLLANELRCLRAEALSESGEIVAAAKVLFSMASKEAAGWGMPVAYYRASARIAAKADVGLARAMAIQGKRLCTYQGNKADAVQFDSTISGSVSEHPPENTYRANAVVNAIASVLGHGHGPRELGEQLRHAIEILRCSPKTMVTRGGDAQGLTESSNHAVLSLGQHQGSDFILRCDLPDDPLELIVLGELLHIGAIAVSVARTRRESEARAALWPAENVEEPTDALFMAEEMRSLFAVARRIATTNAPVLITGETGTGKEVLAKTIHASSNRVKATFLPFNCTSTPKDMLDSQLFGHRRGSFTGAVDNYVGVIRAAAGGTLFLDEIGDMPLDLQPKLLRFLESNEVHPIGETQPVRVDVRVIAATNANLDTLVAEGRFREDLFYRLNIVRLHLPALRERRVEIPALANHYLQKYAVEYGKNDLRLAEETMEYLVLYGWPGNVRQLANEMRRAAALCETGAVVMPEHLSPEIAATRRTIPASERTLEPTEVVVRLDQPLAAATEHLERTMVQYALKKCGGHMEETAALLGLSRKGLYLKRQRFGIDPPESAVTPEVA